MLLPYPRIVRVVRLDSSAQGVRNFLSYLSRDNNNPAATTWWTGGDDPTDDDITELYLMAREYEETKSYDRAFVNVSHVMNWMERSPCEVFAMACRAKNIDQSLAEQAILRFGDHLEANEGPIDVTLDQNRWMIHEISADSRTARGLASMMHREYLQAYRVSHAYVWGVIREMLLAHGPRNVSTFLEGRRRVVLVVLADGFLHEAGLGGCAQASVDEVASYRELFANMDEHIRRHIHIIDNGARTSPHSLHSSTHERPSNTREDATGASVSAEASSILGTSSSSSPGRFSSSNPGNASSSNSGEASSSSSGNASRNELTSSASDDILASNMEL